MKKMSIVIPAYNEQSRIGRTIRHYWKYFDCLRTDNKFVDFELLVVLNGCKDNTLGVVQELQKELGPEVRILNLGERAGKGLAIKEGFADALTRDNDYIGFVDADMATQPEYFQDIVESMHDADGVIASRYIKGSIVKPPRPAIKKWGRILVYNALVKLLFFLRHKDLQCGAKLFRREVVATIVPHIVITQWAFDVELLYLCKKNGFCIKEIPTVWYDQDESKLKIMGSGLRMLGNLFKLRLAHSPFRRFVLK